MKKFLAIILTLIACVVCLCSCGSNSSSNYDSDDSWKSKTWDEMTGGEKQKTYNYLKDQIEKKWY